GHEGRWFGVFATADVLGFGTGPLVAGVIRQVISFHAVFVAMATMMGISAVIVTMALPRKQPVRERMEGDADEYGVPFLQALKDRAVLALTIHMTLVSLSFGSMLSFLGLRLEDDLHIGPALIGVAFSTQDLTGGVAQPLFGRLADRFERRLLVAIGLTSLGALLMSLGLLTSFALVVLWLFLMGASNAIAQVSASAIQVVAGRRVGMGTVLGLGSAGNGLGIVFGSLIGGVLKDLWGIPAAFFFGGLGIASGAPLFLYLTRGLKLSEYELARPGLHGPAAPEKAIADLSAGGGGGGS
ncbi:MAG: MFS transporter, partial [Hyphomicrobiales bacterium]